MDIKYKIIRDTREQNGWTFVEGPFCGGMVSGALKTGDYSIQGYEDLLTIERKGTIAEFAANLIEDRFTRELERMELFKYSFIVLEFLMDDLIRYPKGAGIPPEKVKSIKLSPAFLLKRLVEVQIKFKTKILFAGCYGQAVALSIFKRVVENAGPRSV